jgi:glutaredoxin
MFFVIALEGCPYSEKCVHLMNSCNLKPNVSWVNHENKHLYKKKNYSTFPQVFFKIVNKNKTKHKNIFLEV